MARTRYNKIYTVLREKMEDGIYVSQGLLPSENTLVKEFGCSRSAIHRAIGQLASEGYVQSIHDRGMRIIYQPGQQQSEFVLGSIEGLKEAVAGNRKNYTTRVVCFAEPTMDETIRGRITFLVGTQIYYIQRVRCVEGGALIIDHDYSLRGVMRDLAPEVAERSIYECMENDLGESIMTTKRKVTVEHINQIDEKYPDLKDYNCMAVVSSMIYNKGRIIFELTQSRCRPDRFVFYDPVHRTKQVG